MGPGSVPSVFPTRETAMAAIAYMKLVASVIALRCMVGLANAEENRVTTTTGLSPGTAQAGDKAQVQEGRSLFNETCAHCHGPDAVTGLSERNLRHLRARYGADMHDVFTSTVMNGRPDKGMPVWGEVLDAKTIDKIYSYLETIQEDAQ
jgi:polar amino acid transport system substrate-binding protein